MGDLRNHDKLAAAVHLVIARLPPGKVGATKLNKILWFADCEFYRRHGRSLTGEREYLRKDNGPCPVRIGEVLSRLKQDGAIVETPQPLVNFTRREFTPLVDPDINLFTAEEVDVLLSVALEIAPLSAAKTSELSHSDLWHGTLPNGRMTVEAGSVRVLPPTADVLEWASSAFAAE